MRVPPLANSNMEYRAPENGITKEADLYELVLALLEEPAPQPLNLMDEPFSAASENGITEEDEYIEQLLVLLEGPALQRLNLMDEPLSAAQLPEPLRPQPFCLRPPARRPQPYREVWRLFDPAPPPRKRTSTPAE